jgi:hypothetical protein
VWTDSGGFVHTASGVQGAIAPAPDGVGQTSTVSIQKITGPDDHPMNGFVLRDLPDVPADGVVRWARKILVDGARTLARSRTYTWALLERRRSGASAGISAEPSEREHAIGVFVDAVLPQVGDGSLHLLAGKGVAPADLAALDAAWPGPRAHTEPARHGTLADELLAAGVVAAALGTLGSLEGRTATIEGAGTAGPAIVAELAAAGVRVVGVATPGGAVVGGPEGDELAEAWARHGDDLPAAIGSELPGAEVLGVEADLLLCGSRAGLVDHEVAASLAVRAVVPVGPAPVTAKGLAVATRNEVTVLADACTLLGSVVALDPDGGDADERRLTARDRAREVAAAAAGHVDGPYLGACALAESFLRTWCDELPFGRPLA